MWQGVYEMAKLSICGTKVEMLGNKLRRCAADKQSGPLGKKPTVR